MARKWNRLLTFRRRCSAGTNQRRNAHAQESPTRVEPCSACVHHLFGESIVLLSSDTTTHLASFEALSFSGTAFFLDFLVFPSIPATMSRTTRAISRRARRILDAACPSFVFACEETVVNVYFLICTALSTHSRSTEDLCEGCVQVSAFLVGKSGPVSQQRCENDFSGTFGRQQDRPMF